MQAQMLVFVFLFSSLVSVVTASCGRCSPMTAKLSCRPNKYVQTNPNTDGLACDVYRGDVVLDCMVDGMLPGQNVTSFTFKKGRKDISNWTIIASDKKLGNITLENVLMDNAYVCEALVNDFMGQPHILRSNSILIKKIYQDTYSMVSPTNYKSVSMNDRLSYITVLNCSIPTGWYPEPQFYWLKDDKILKATNRVFPIEFDVGAYKKGSLLFHGYNTSDINMEYKCVIMWDQMDKVMEEQYNRSMGPGGPEQNGQKPNNGRKKRDAQLNYDDVPPHYPGPFSKNRTTNWYKLILGDVPMTTAAIYDVAIGIPTYGAFVGWGQNTTVEMYAVGGNYTSSLASNEKTRAVYSWKIIGSENGLRILNESCVAKMKGNSTNSTSKRSTPPVTVHDYFAFPHCHYWGTNKTQFTLTLNDGVMAKYGIFKNKLGNRLTFGYSYGFDKIMFNATVVFNSGDSSEKSVNKVYQGINIVSGKPPRPGNNTCGYFNTSVELPESPFFKNVFSSEKYPVWSDYNIYNILINGTATNSLSQTKWVVNMTEQVAGKCHYYQLTRTNPSWGNTSLWSYIYETVLVESLGVKAGNETFDPKNYRPPNITIAVGNITGMYKFVNFTSKNSETKLGTFSQLDMLHCDPQVVKIMPGVPMDNCSYGHSVKIDMTRLDRNCTIEARAKSQCTMFNFANQTVKPVFCKLPNETNIMYVDKNGTRLPEMVLYQTKARVLCNRGYQREGAEVITCQANGKFNAPVKCVDLTKVTCLPLDPGYGVLICNATVSPATCTYLCPQHQFYKASNTTVASNKTITCSDSTAKWSHMSESNPTGELPNCSPVVTPTSYQLTVTIAFSGATSCIDGTTAALRTTLNSSNNPAFACMKNSDCTLSNVKCSSSTNHITLAFLINQTSGNLSSSATINTFMDTIVSLAANKSFTISVSSAKRTSTTLSANGEVSADASAVCPSGSGMVDTTCLKCPPGQYSENGVCYLCPKDTYSDTNGATNCTSCTGGNKTFTTGTDSASKCTVLCTVKTVENGKRVPTSGSVIGVDVQVTTYCSTNYSVPFGKPDFTTCSASEQATCYQKCTIKKVHDKVQADGVAYKVGDRLEFMNYVSYRCTGDKATEPMRNVKCLIAGEEIKITCPEIKYGLIIGVTIACITGAGIMFVAIKQALKPKPIDYGPTPPLPTRNRGPPPPIPQQEVAEKDDNIVFEVKDKLFETLPSVNVPKVQVPYLIKGKSG